MEQARAETYVGGFFYLLIALLVLSAQGCKERGPEKGGAMHEDIEKVMETHTEELMAVPGVVGVAIGATAEGTPCIQVLVEKITAQIRSRVPDRLEGHPVILVETGKIEALDEESH